MNRLPRVPSLLSCQQTLTPRGHGVSKFLLAMMSQFKSLWNNIFCLKYFHINVSFQVLTGNKRNIAQGNGHVI
jgi:hypothetical protein